MCSVSSMQVHSLKLTLGAGDECCSFRSLCLRAKAARSYVCYSESMLAPKLLHLVRVPKSNDAAAVHEVAGELDCFPSCPLSPYCF